MSAQKQPHYQQREGGTQQKQARLSSISSQFASAQIYRIMSVRQRETDRDKLTDAERHND